ncbi:ParA family protein [Streptomyces antarcticus]|uniref:ParA family protein n=1 Tax=Streptomyces antarcticus TaxID=2996458 RepID=UPI00226EE00B|nr:MULTISPECIES: ParA family protein [unclassified Streptomyces]MCY0942885.1 ParA family protein [Streptomyces sp. H34-AA3]MCY0953069.1 ParA family protein [Streptomyces sp. H27-S2]MCZ4087331.1 ParA family protein [Streptomyces sp. H34-S5]
MTAPYDPSDREKVVAKLPLALRQELKVRAAQLSVDIQDAVTEGIHAWRQAAEPAPVDTSGGSSFATYLPAGLYDDFKKDCKSRSVAYNQGLAQAIRLWLDTHTMPKLVRPAQCRRFVVCNQKGGVGKSAVSAGLSQALAEAGARVCVIDFDPQGHLTKHLGQTHLGIKEASLAKHMLGEADGSVRDLLIPIEYDAFMGRLFLLPACKDAFLLDAKLATTRNVRVKETALEKAVEELEKDFDYIVVDCPPSLGYTMDTALYLARTRDGEDSQASGLVVVVQAEDTSADAYDLLLEQIEDMEDDLEVAVTQLGFVVNLYDARKGYIATSSLDSWQEFSDPPVLVVIPDVKEQREAVRLKRPLLDYAPDGEQAIAMRNLKKALTK